MNKNFLLISFVLVAGGVHAQSRAHDELTRIAEDYIYTSARLFPSQATALGITKYDGDLEVPSEKGRVAYIAQLNEWQKRVRAVAGDGSALSLVDRDDAQLLETQLAQQLNARLVYQQDRKDYSLGANTFVGAIFLQLQFLPVAGRDGATSAMVHQGAQDDAKTCSMGLTPGSS